jgi:pyruvate dehydrogenase E2 component (dihydrolipoamide acetyltransferase)
MTIDILMPALSPTMTEGTLLKWHVKEGDAVGSGDILAEIETDKATMEVEAVEEGRIGKLLVPEGTEGVAVNAPIAVLLEEGEDASAIAAIAAPPAPAAAPPAPTAAPPSATPAPAAAAPAPAPPAASGGRITASPLAKRMARQAGLDLAAIRGSGPQGRVIKRDIEAALSGGAPAVQAAPAPVAAPAAAPAAVASAPAAAGPSAVQLADMLGMAYELQPLSSMRTFT